MDILALQKFCIKAFTLAVVIMTVSVNSYAGGDHSGGGDICEARIKIIRDDIKNWIVKGGHKELSLPSELSADEYSDRMLKQIASTKVIRCVSSGDAQYPVAINNSPKTCRFDMKLQQSQITCDSEKFNKTTDTDQYVLIHHEFAGLAGIELPDQEDSKYEISNQISDYLVDVVIKKLAVKNSANNPGIPKLTCKEIASSLRFDGSPWADRELLDSYKAIGVRCVTEAGVILEKVDPKRFFKNYGGEGDAWRSRGFSDACVP